MTLLDYFAGQALKGYITKATYNIHSSNDIAKFCYDDAEAMLKEREKRMNKTNSTHSGQTKEQ
jgi:hypothetical protein